MEPLRRTQAGLVRAGVAEEAELDQIRADAGAELRDIGDAIEAEPPVTVEEIAGTVHRETPWGLLPDGLREPSWRAGGGDQG